MLSMYGGGGGTILSLCYMYTDCSFTRDVL